MTDQQHPETAKNKQQVPRQKATAKPPTAVVGIGSSAGGLEALNQFFLAMPADSGLAFVLVSHLDPHHDSMLPGLIGNKTKMATCQVTDGQGLIANHIYIIVPDKELVMVHNRLHLLPRKKGDGNFRPIDVFFQSLAKDAGNKAIGIILSGTGTDGSQGIKAIAAAQGLVLAQDKDSAKFPGMPTSAQATGLVDHILAPEMMPQFLLDALQAHRKTARISTPSEADSVTFALQKIMGMIRSVTGHDFSLYKKNTIFRRIERRMYVHQLQTIDDYVNFLQESEREVRILFKDLLIGVTSFLEIPRPWPC